MAIIDQKDFISSNILHSTFFTTFDFLLKGLLSQDSAG